MTRHFIETSKSIILFGSSDQNSIVNMSSLAPVTRRVARIILSTVKKIGNTKGINLKKIYEYIRDEYPNTPKDIVKLNNNLQKALAFGVVSKKNGK